MPQNPLTRPPAISSPRLDLILLELAHLRALLTDQPWPTPYADPTGFLTSEPGLLQRRLIQEEADPEVHGWLLRAAVLTSTNEVVGRVNFHDRPDPDGMVEIGYTIHPGHRRRGYGRELAMAMWTWAAARADVTMLRASVSPDNAASLAIVTGAGFVEVGTQIDPEDGLELVFELSAKAFLERR